MLLHDTAKENVFLQNAILNSGLLENISHRAATPTPQNKRKKNTQQGKSGSYMYYIKETYLVHGFTFFALELNQKKKKSRLFFKCKYILFNLILIFHHILILYMFIRGPFK